MTENQDKNVSNSSKVIPTSIKENFDKFEDAPRDESEIHKFNSPVDVIQSTSQKSTVISDEVAKVTLDEELNEALSMDSGLNSILDSLNITRKQFYSFVLFIIGLIVMVIVSFVFLFKYFGTSEEQVRVISIPNQEVSSPTSLEEDESEKFGIFDRFTSLFSKGEDKKPDVVVEEVESVVPVEVEETEEVSIPASEVGRISVDQFDSSAISASIKLGTASLRENRLSFYVRTYRQVRNIFNTDLFSYLSQVPDRSQGYNLYLTQFKGANEQAKLAFEELRQEIEELDARVDLLREEATVLENQFFDSLDNLESEFIQERLRAFQDISRRRDLAISELKARQGIAAIYTKALPLIETKITAIEVNKDPFVQGVRVVDFEQVDLDLIIRAE